MPPKSKKNIDPSVAGSSFRGNAGFMDQMSAPGTPTNEEANQQEQIPEISASDIEVFLGGVLRKADL
jgi:hypothetical protein